MLSLIYFLVILGLLLLIIEIISIILKVTGLELQKARFQVISILTHTGFTTRESELISQHPLRRKIASYLMLISYVGQATLISLFINILADQKRIINFLAVIIFLTIFILVVTKNKFILSRFDKLLEKYILHQIEKNKKFRTIDEVLKLNPEYGVYEIILDENNSLCGMSLREAKLKDRFIQILNIDRGYEIIAFPDANLVLQPTDKIVVYGKITSIKELLLNQK